MPKELEDEFNKQNMKETYNYFERMSYHSISCLAVVVVAVSKYISYIHRMSASENDLINWNGPHLIDLVIMAIV